MPGCARRRTPGSNGVARSFCRTRRCTRSPNGVASASAAPTYRPSERLADLENTLAQVKLDPAENAPLARAALRHSAAAGTRASFAAGGIAAPAIGSADQLG